jgi:serine protease Do
VIVSSDGYILTNNHVVAGEQAASRCGNCRRSRSRSGDKRELRAQIVGVDPTIDLALLKVDARNLPTMPGATHRS